MVAGETGSQGGPSDYCTLPVGTHHLLATLTPWEGMKWSFPVCFLQEEGEAPQRTYLRLYLMSSVKEARTGTGPGG